MNKKTVFPWIRKGSFPKHVLLMGMLAFLIIPLAVSGGTTGTAAITGNVIQPPVALFAANITTGYVPLPVRFTDLSTGTPVAWNWDFGDGTNSSDQNPTHIYTTPGTWSVTLNITDLIGISSTVVKTHAVTTLQVPARAISGSSVPVNTGNNINGGSADRYVQVTNNLLSGFRLAPTIAPEATQTSATAPRANIPNTPSGAPLPGQMAPGQTPAAPGTSGDVFLTGLFLLGIAGVISAFALAGIAAATIFRRE